MKKIVLLATVLLLTSTPVMADKIIVKTAGMMCESCAATVTDGFDKQEGVNAVQIDLEKQLVTIDVQDANALPDDVIEKTLTERDYEFISVERVSE